jgi:fumarate hydratase subunit beta
VAISVSSPIPLDIIDRLTAGDNLLLSGIVYTARDAAHRRLVEALKEGNTLPFELTGQTLYYVGPSPARPGRASGAAGPTTSGRMDACTLPLLAAGLRVMIGKGDRSTEVKEAMRCSRAVYLTATGGAGALLGKAVQKAEVIAYPELGPEAVLRLEVENMPVIVAYDTGGGDIFASGRSKYRKKQDEGGQQ